MEYENRGEQPMAASEEELNGQEEEDRGGLDNESNDDVNWIMMNGIQDPRITLRILRR